MRKLALIFLGFFISITYLAAQNNNTPNISGNQNDDPMWINMMQDHDANYFETVEAFNSYWKNNSDRKSNGYNPFKRWEWYMKHKIYPDGTRRPNGLDRQMYSEFVANQKTASSFTGNWINIGPIDLPSSPNVFWGNGRVNAIAFHPTDVDVIFVGAPAGGLWKSDDSGQSWTPLTDNQPTLGVSSIVVDHSNPDIIYIGTGDRDAGDAAGLGVFKSVDGGITFDPANNNMESATVGRMLMHPSNSQILLAATNIGILKSTDGAASWTLTQGGNMKELVFKPNDPTVVYASATGKFYKSTDGGDSFVRIENGTPTSASRGVIDVSAANPNYVYFFTTGTSSYYGTYLSTDAGESFTLRSNSPNVMGWSCSGGSGGQAWYDLDIAVDPTDENVIYAGGINCWKSTNAAQSWTMVSNQTGDCGAAAVHADLHVLEWNPLNGYLYVGNDGGIWYTDDDGSTWNRITSGLAIGQQYKLGQSKLTQNHVTTGYQDNGISLYHTNIWIQSDMYADGMEAEMDNTDTTLSYGCMQYGRMYRMVNDKAESLIAGQGIGGITESGQWVTPFCQHETDNEVMFAGYQNLWKTTNLQSSSPSWTKISNNVGNGAVAIVEHSPANHNLFYYGTAGNSLVRSENIMESNIEFVDLQGLLPGVGSLNDIEAHPWDENIVYVTRGTGIYKSENKGESWEDISGNLPDMNLNDVAFYDRNNVEGLYVATNIGVFFKDEYMTDWIMFSENLPAAILVTEVEIYYDEIDRSEDRIRASTYGRGLWGSPTYYYAPVADFEASETNIPAGCAIDFFDRSQGYPHSWQWSFQGGTPSTSDQPNPSNIIFENEGVFEVSLTVSNPDGSDTKTVTGYITVVEGMLPQVDFTSDLMAQCTNQPVQFTDMSEGCPTQWQWSFEPDNVTYLEGTSSSSPSPIVSLSEIGAYSVTLDVSNSSGQSSLTKTDYLFIGGQLLPFSEDFAGSSFSEMGWEIQNPDVNLTWELTDVISPNGIMEQTAWIKHFNAPNFGARDYMISPMMSFSGFDNIFMTFEYAYAERYAPSDSLIVSISDDCGESWTRVYADGPDGQGAFSTSEPTTDFFIPESPDDWCVSGYGPRCPIIDLTEWAGLANIKVRFESYSRYGNNLYVKSVDISNSVGIFDSEEYGEVFSIHPNPANSYVTVIVSPEKSQVVELLDAKGRVLNIENSQAGKVTFDLVGISKGLYFIRVNSKAKKLIVN